MTYFSGGCGPDSMGMDIEGNLYVANFGNGTIYVVEGQKGEVLEQWVVPFAEKAYGTDNCRFGGKDNKTLFITEGWERYIFKVECNIPGLPIPNVP